MTSMTGNPDANVSQLANPSMPMAFLPPEVAYQATISIYVVVGSGAVFAWDILNNLGADYLLLFKYSIKAPTVAYFISRLAALSLVLTSTIFSTASVGDCRNLQTIMSGMFCAAVSSTALLFFLRIRAIFDRNTGVVIFFGAMWFAVLVGTMATILGNDGRRIGSTDYCMMVDVQPYVAASGIIPLVNDTLVFLAISCRLMGFAYIEHSATTRIRTLAYGDYLPALSRTLLQDGQAYYLATVTTSLMAVIMFYIDALPAVYKTMFTVSNVTVMNIMACRVFRNIKFGVFREAEISTSSVIIAQHVKPDKEERTQKEFNITCV